MAKRNKTQANESGEQAARPKERRSRAKTIPQDVAGERAAVAEHQPDELPDIPEPGDAADRAARSESMSSEPSEADIRLRAYHRYLERGGKHGAHFDDWVAAEQELRTKK